MKNNIITITAKDGASRFQILPELGGLGISLQLPYQGKARELLYLPEDFFQREDQFWQGGWPLCFPICGRLTTKEMPIHGFAPYMPWAVKATTTDSVTIFITDTKETRAQFPYAFYCECHFEIMPNAFSCTLTVENKGNAPMPYYAGFHPYFLTPLAQKDQIQVDFMATKRLQYNDSLTDVIGELPALNLPKPVSDPALNEQLSRVEKNCSKLIYPDGCVIEMQVDSPGSGAKFPYIQLYTREDAPFFCIEPWMNHPNALNHVQNLTFLSINKSNRSKITLNCT